ncbi:MAG: hypothetical protein ACR2QO_12055 [Acidimicrobiales bacterium]
MTKRIVSGVFLLIALGALGLILAGALTSGEQLIVRFLTAIIVAALCLYVISDLRLQADDSSASRASVRKVPDGARRRATAPAALPPNSTAAFMATVTGKRSTSTASHDLAELADEHDESMSPPPVGDSELDIGPEVAPRPQHHGERDHEVVAIADHEEQAPAYTDDTVDAEAWPALPDDPADLDEERHSDGLVAIFSKQNQSEELQGAELESVCEIEQHALVVNDHYRPPTSPYLPSPKLTSIDGGALRVESLRTPNSPTSDENLGDEQETAIVLVELRELGDPHANPEPIVEEVEEVGEVGRSVTESAAMELTVVAATEETEAEVTEVSETLIEQAPASTPPSPAEIRPVTAMPGLEAAARARSRVIELLSGDDGVGDIDDAITSGELGIITSLVEDGSLSLEGPITDRDVRTMVFVAFTSSELRKILFAGGSLDSDEFDGDDLDLGPVEVFQPAEAEPDDHDEPAELEQAGSPELAEPSTSTVDGTELNDATQVEDAAPEDAHVETNVEVEAHVDVETKVDVAEQQPLVAG